MSCVSRRAHADRNSFKLFKEENGSIKEKNYVWTEFRCPNAVLDGIELCSECCSKVSDYKYQAAPKFNHGIVGGPYTPQSKLYGSPYYLKFIKEGWKIRDDDERRAKEAQHKANMPPRKVKTDDAGVKLTIKATMVADPPLVSSPSLTSPKKPRKMRTVKTPVALPSPSAGPAEFVESMEAPTPVNDIIVVKVKKIKCSGSDYYYDSASGKLYAVSTKGVGQYKGRYNPEEETIDTSYPDSDDE